MLNPLIPYIGATVGLLVMLGLFVSLKRELYRNTQRERKRVDGILASVRPPESAAPEPVYVPVQLRPGMNVERRVHALRLHRRGEDAAHIAAALGMQRREVELLLRVHGASQPV